MLLGVIGLLLWTFGDVVGKAVSELFGSKFVDGKLDAAGLLALASSGVKFLFESFGQKTADAVKGAVSHELATALLAVQNQQRDDRMTMLSSLEGIANSLAGIVEENRSCHADRSAHTAVLEKHGEALAHIGRTLRKLDPEFVMPDLAPRQAMSEPASKQSATAAEKRSDSNGV